jgi:hypothetical protein
MDRAPNYAELPALRQPTAWVLLVVEPHRSPVLLWVRPLADASFCAALERASQARNGQYVRHGLCTRPSVLTCAGEQK